MSPADVRRRRQDLARIALGTLMGLTLAAGSAHAAGKGRSSAGAGDGGKAGPAAAGKSDARAQAKAAVERAQVDYKLGRFQEALEGYRRAYELFQAPILLFDMGQCHRNLDDPEKAIFFFEGYLREETRSEPERRRLTEQLLVESRADLQRKMAVTTPPPPAPAPPPARPVRLQAMDTQQVVPATPVLVAARTADVEHDSQAPRAHRSITSRWWFWTAIAGAAVVAAGAAVYYATGDPRLTPPPSSLGTVDGEHPPMSAMSSP